VLVEMLPQGGEVVRVAGELDLASVAELESAFAVSGVSGRLILDLSECTFLDSTAIHVILAEAGRRSEGNGGVAVVAPDAGIRRPLEIAEVDRILPIHASLADALT
jgi:anti-anti-sigma factor